MPVPERLRDGAETYEEKNDDYGDSWQTVGEILWELGGEEPIVLESPEDVISFGLFVRRFDKLARAFNGEFRAEDLNFESIVDSHEDESVYAMMSAELRDEPDEVVYENVSASASHPTTIPEDYNGA